MASPGPQSAAEAIPFRISPVLLPQPQCAIPPPARAAMAEELEATRKKRRTEHREQAEVAAASWESPRPPATPDSKPESPAPVAPETLTATAVAAGKGRTRKKEEVVVALAAAVGMEEKKKRKRSRHVEAAAIPLPSAATAHVLEVAEKEAVARKEQRQGKVVQEQSGQLPFPIDAHPQGGEAAVNGGVSGIHCVKMDRFGKPRVLSKKQMLKVQMDFSKQNRKHQVFIPTVVNPNSIDPDPKYSSPYGALLFDQFSYKPDRPQGRSAPSLPKTPEHPARPLSRDHLSSRSSQVTANETFMDANTTILTTKQPRSASASGPQEEVEVEEEKGPETNMSSMNKPRKPGPLLSAAEKQEVASAAASSPLVEEAVGMEEKKKRKRSRHVEAAAIPLPSAATAHALEVAEKGVVARKEQRQGKVVQEQSGQLPFPIDAHPQGGEAAVNGGVSGIHCVKMDRFGKPRVLSKKQMLKVQIDFSKQNRKHQVFIPTVVNPNSIDPDPKYSSPYGALLFDQFSYKPDRPQGRSAPSLPKTPEHPARPLSRDHLSSRSSQVTANETFMDANTTILTTKQPRSASASGPQEEVEVEEEKGPETNMSSMNKPRKPGPLLSAAEKQEVASAAASSPLVEEAVGMEEKKKRKRSRHVEAAAIPLPSAATAHALEVAEKGVVARKEQRQGKVVQEQSGQLPFPIDAHPQGGEAAVNGGVSGIHCVKMDRFGKPRVLSKKQMLKVQIDFSKQNRKHQVFIPTVVNPNSIDPDPKYSSPYGALLFDQFSYKPDRPQGRSAPSLPKTPEHPARPLWRDHLSSRSSQVAANETFMDANTTILTTKQPRSASASGPQEEVEVEPEKNISSMKKPRKRALSADMYRRLPLNELVRPPRSPHKLLQEKYASDPWKVMVICMLLNQTQGKQVRKKVKGFFRRYPDAQTALKADPEKMAEYLAPLGLQHVKTNRIQKFSKGYVGEEWKYVTELCGVGKYAADAYAIFCAGRATDVVPEDHKLVDYWNYICFELPSIQARRNAQDVGVTTQGNFAPEVKQVALSC